MNRLVECLVTTGSLGADAAWDRLLAEVPVSVSKGEGKGGVPSSYSAGFSIEVAEMIVRDRAARVSATYNSFLGRDSASKTMAWSNSKPLTSKVVPISLRRRTGRPLCLNSP